ncbi:MAG: hypothetical protein ACYDCK_10755 [Thermoplasmatota archaeon]
MSRLVLVLVAVVVLTAGCIASSKSPASPTALGSASNAGTDGMAMGAKLMPLALNGTSCTWGGGHSIHTHQYDSILPLPWKPADVIEDIGTQPSYSDPGEQVYGVMVNSGWGNWHTNMECSAWTLNGEKKELTFGMILTRIVPPSFDTNPVPRNYMVNVIASSDKQFNDILMAAGWMAMPASGYIDWTTTPDTFHHLLDAGDHGVYESIFHTKDVGPMKDDVIRLWYQHANPDKTFTPVAIDMKITKKGEHYWGDLQGYFSHTRTHDHDPVPGAYGQIAGLVYTGFDASFGWGPQTNVMLDKAYEHA